MASEKQQSTGQPSLAGREQKSAWKDEQESESSDDDEAFGVPEAPIRGRSLARIKSPEPVYEEVKETPEKVPTIKLNQLVIKPSTFKGVKPPARKWIDDYERASKANGWSEKLSIKYFATFLDSTALD